MDPLAGYSVGDKDEADDSMWYDQFDLTTAKTGGFNYVTHDPTYTFFPENVSLLSNQTKGNSFFYQTEQLTFLCILFVFIIIGNLCVLIAILLSKNRKSRMNFFIMQLAIADLLTGLITVLTDIIWKTTVEFHAGNVGCKIVKYLQSTVMFASTYVLVALSIDRLDAIARPMHFSGSGKRARILILVAWGTSMAFSSPLLILPEGKLINGMKQCHIFMPEHWHWKLFITLLALVLYIIPAIIIAMCYTVIVVIIWSKASIGGKQKPAKMSRRFTRNNGTINGNSKTERYANSSQSQASSRGLIPKARIKTIKMTLVIVLVFIICWSPFFVFDLLDVYGHIPTSQRKVAITIFIQSLAPLNSAANPLIYCLFSTRICSNWRRLPMCDWLARNLFCCCQEEKPRRNPSFNSSLTEYTTMENRLRANTRVSSGPANSRRHSGTPFVKGSLSAKENQILLKHIRTEDQPAVNSADEVDSTDDIISSM